MIPAAVLWDMDGTLVDTEPWFLDAVDNLVTTSGGRLGPAEHQALTGASLPETADIAIRAGARLPPDRIIKEVTGAVRARLANGVPWRPGARQLLAAVRAAGIPTALVTMSYRELAHDVVTAIGFPAFDVIVAGDDVERGKPDPEAYLRALDLLGVDATACVALEDSPPGVAAAVAAGVHVIAVPGSVELPPSSAYTIWPSLAGRALDDLAQILNPARLGSRTALPRGPLDSTG